MLCEISYAGNFFTTWVAVSVIALLSVFILSGSVFYRYYVHTTYEDWRFKSNPKFPEVTKVRDEIKQMIKGIVTAAFCPALSLYLAQHKLSKGYCGAPEGYGYGYMAFTFVTTWIVSDFFEFFYHYLGHSYDQLWNVHKYHHYFWNPSPFAVVADEYLDQLVRASPLLIYPLLFPINIDMLFFQFGVFFYGYGTYIHWGFEFDKLDAHHPWINTSFQHYLHHAVSSRSKPYHCGFFLKLWDNMFGSAYDKECFCAKCEQKKGKRTKAQWEEIKKTKPSYKELLQPSFWMAPLKNLD